MADQRLGIMPKGMAAVFGGQDAIAQQIEEADLATLKVKAKMPPALANVLGGQERVDAAVIGQNNQRTQGGANGTVNGTSTTGSKINSGTNAVSSGPGPGIDKGAYPAQDPSVQVARIGNTAMAGKTPYVSRFDQPASDKDVVTRADGSMSWLGDVNQERSDRSPGTTTRVGDPVPKSNGNGTVSGYTPPDYEAAISTMKGLKEAKIEAAGGRGNRGKGMQDYEKQQSYAQDLGDYGSGDVGSEGYNRIRTERMNLESMIADQQHALQRSAQRSSGGMKGLAAAQASIANNSIDGYTKSQEARLGYDAEAEKNQVDMNKAAMDSLSDNAKLALASQKEMFGQQNADREFGLKKNQFGLDMFKANTDQQYKQGQLGVDAEKLNQGQYELGLKAGDYASKAEERGWNNEFGAAKTQMEAARLGMEPGKVIDTIMKQEGGMPAYPSPVRVQRLRTAGYTDEQIQQIDPTGYAEVMQQQQAGK